MINQPLSIDVSKIDNAVLKRLIAEVQYEQQNNINSYNRVHNRHNRSGGPSGPVIIGPLTKEKK